MRIRECRAMRGLTQRQLADLIGVTYQQAHKYERGINRVPAGRLYEIARNLDMPIDYFFNGSSEVTERPPRQRRLLEKVMQHYREIHDKKQREVLSQITRVLAGR